MHSVFESCLLRPGLHYLYCKDPYTNKTTTYWIQRIHNLEPDACCRKYGCTLPMLRSVYREGIGNRYILQRVSTLSVFDHCILFNLQFVFLLVLLFLELITEADAENPDNVLATQFWWKYGLKYLALGYTRYWNVGSFPHTGIPNAKIKYFCYTIFVPPRPVVWIPSYTPFLNPLIFKELIEKAFQKRQCCNLKQNKLTYQSTQTYIYS